MCLQDPTQYLQVISDSNMFWYKFLLITIWTSVKSYHQRKILGFSTQDPSFPHSLDFWIERCHWIQCPASSVCAVVLFRVLHRHWMLDTGFSDISRSRNLSCVQRAKKGDWQTDISLNFDICFFLKAILKVQTFFKIVQIFWIGR